MTTEKLIVEVALKGGVEIRVEIAAYPGALLFEEDKMTASDNNESTHQLTEGGAYEYIIDHNAYQLEERPGIISHFRLGKTSGGRITPNAYVGNLEVRVIDIASGTYCGAFYLEVRSHKLSYRSDYRRMLEDITNKSVDLLLQHTSPVEQSFVPDFNADANTLYQRFAFVKSLINADEFTNAVHKIIHAPVTQWEEKELQQNLSAARRMGSKVVRQIANARNRVGLPEEHALRSRLQSVPASITTAYKRETADTPENRFIKHVLQTFAVFCSDFRTHAGSNYRLAAEALQLEEKMEQFLQHALFQEITTPRTLPLSSPVLQRKEGYREILRAWLMFDLAAKLIWQGGDDVYKGGKRDVAVLYEYWLFFKLLDTIGDIFEIEPRHIATLIKDTSDKLGVQLKQGTHIPLEGVYRSATRWLHIRFSYNRTFKGKNQYPAKGSWTTSLRPDYTLSIWPYGITDEEAEEQELMVHIHFDAKYRVDGWTSLFDTDHETLSTEKEEQNKGVYKRADLMKMHTYRDAIRRTGGAYVIYPGSESHQARGYHELLPGIGAFGVNPSDANRGLHDIQVFLKDVTAHLLNRASQRERISLKTYQVYKDKNEDTVNEWLPETYHANRALLPDETYVLIGYYRDQDHLDWIAGKLRYNTRTGQDQDTIRLGIGEAAARYLLLYSAGEVKKTARLYKIVGEGPRVFPKEQLKDAAYQYQPTTAAFYLVYELSGQVEEAFKGKAWNISILEKYKSGRASGLPFAVTLRELMKTAIRS